MTSRLHISLKRTLLFAAPLLFSLRIIGAEHFAFADDYFHGGALRYLSNNVPAALDIVTNGLLQFPNDEKLKKLEALLKQQQNQQDQQQDQKKSDDQKQQDQKKDQQSKKDDQQKEKDKKEQDKKDQQKSDEQKEKEKQDQQKKGQQPKPDEQKNPEQQQAEAAQGKEMTPEQAMRVLDTTKNDEKVLPVQMERPPQTGKKLKDW